ncbi:hypothetical protein RCH16_003595 [Cryobacterium sp. MP_M5]|uniref:protein-tyrosine phosphatase family protein n=1 Tax=unclassified Cryobacterium TaxID=2649013 RepID=UPI0018CAED50|nr:MULTISPECIES: hypothetical protein [unclassified Cryobacterium]MBG6058975.1 hypothetical protein [Cryobacterium sp. MP_M3]MEC5178556.1 hypothetical protein [Cryobacterium sp. MP_M5]
MTLTRPDRFDYAYLGDVSTLVRHPHDHGIWLGAAGALDAPPDEVDAVVSLCRVGTRQVPARIRHHLQVRLIDKDDPAENPNLDVVLVDTVNAIAALRAEGHTVLLHCAQAQSRTPSVAALYAALHRGVPIRRALAEVLSALPAAAPRRFLREALVRLSPTGGRACRDPGTGFDKTNHRRMPPHLTTTNEETPA